MSLLSKIGIEITHISEDVKVFATNSAKVTTAIKNDLQSNVAIDIAALINPFGETIRQEAISLCTIAIQGCQELTKISDTAGIEGRLQRLGSDLTQLQHTDATHTFSYYCECFEAIYNDLFSNAA